MKKYSFRPISASDIPMVTSWVETPAVREWCTEPDGQLYDPFKNNKLEDPRVAMWIVSHEDRPFAFIQDYDPHGWADHPFADLPSGSRGIDQFIGEPDMISRGHGSAFVRAHTDALLAAGAPAVGTDPDPLNARAVRAYEKAGFVRGEERMTEWGY